MRNLQLYRKADLDYPGFPVVINALKYDRPALIIGNHWHEQIEIMYIKSGEVTAECNMKAISASPGETVIINSNELHKIMCTGVPLEFLCLIFDTSLVQSCFFDVCDKKYITPLEMNMLLFENKISKDCDILSCLESISKEFDQKGIGYELAVKSLVYWLLMLLFRKHRDSALTEQDFDFRSRYFETFNKISVYIDENYTGKIKTDDLAGLVNMSVSNLAHVFKRATGKTITDYINTVRINNALRLIKNTDMNMTEIAMAVGIGDGNYFSKLF